jgi:hypothetical protein
MQKDPRAGIRIRRQPGLFLVLKRLIDVGIAGTRESR